MAKFKTGMAVLLTLAAVILGGLLPWLLNLTTDYLSAEKVRVEPMTPLELHLKEQEERKPYTVEDKLRLLRNEGQAVYVSDDKMQSSRKSIEQAAASYILEMSRRGIVYNLQGITPVISTYPCMMFNLEGSEYEMFWEVGMVYYDDASGTDILATCLLDDDENRVLSFSIQSFQHSLMSNPGEQLPLLAEYYFSGLGLEWTTNYLRDSYLELVLPEAPDLGVSIFSFDADQQGYYESLVEMQIYERGKQPQTEE